MHMSLSISGPYSCVLNSIKLVGRSIFNRYTLKGLLLVLTENVTISALNATDNK